MYVWFLRYSVQQMDGQMNGWKKWHIEMSAHLKMTKAIYTVRTPLFLSVGGGGGGRRRDWTSYQIFKKGGAWQDLNFEREVAGKGGGRVTFFQGKAGGNFTKKKKKKTKIWKI